MKNSKRRVSLVAVVIDDCGKQSYVGRTYAEVTSLKKQRINEKLTTVPAGTRLDRGGYGGGILGTGVPASNPYPISYIYK
ncbi:hypothetical protein LguiA_004439 [Lonicera macranthoides]